MCIGSTYIHTYVCLYVWLCCRVGDSDEMKLHWQSSLPIIVCVRVYMCVCASVIENKFRLFFVLCFWPIVFWYANEFALLGQHLMFQRVSLFSPNIYTQLLLPLALQQCLLVRSHSLCRWRYCCLHLSNCTSLFSSSSSCAALMQMNRKCKQPINTIKINNKK